MLGCRCELLCRVQVLGCLPPDLGAHVGKYSMSWVPLHKIDSQVFPLDTGRMCVCGEGLPISVGHGQMYNFVSFSES